MEAVFRPRYQHLLCFGLPEAAGQRLDIMTALRTLQPGMRDTSLRLLLSKGKGKGEDVFMQAIMEHYVVKSSRNIASLIL